MQALFNSNLPTLTTPKTDQTKFRLYLSLLGREYWKVIISLYVRFTFEKITNAF